MLLMTKAQRVKLIQNMQATRAACEANTTEPDHKPVLKLFSGGATWLVTEGELVGNDFRLFGLGDLGLGHPELGYAMLEQMEASFRKAGKILERDRHFKASHALSVYTAAARRASRITEDAATLDATAKEEPIRGIRHDDDTPAREAEVAEQEAANTRTDDDDLHDPDQQIMDDERAISEQEAAETTKSKRPAKKEAKRVATTNPIEQKHAAESMAIAGALGRPIVYAGQDGETIFVAFPGTNDRAAVHGAYPNLGRAGAEIFGAGYEDFTGSDFDAASLDAIEQGMLDARDLAQLDEDAPKGLPAPAMH